MSGNNNNNNNNQGGGGRGRGGRRRRSNDNNNRGEHSPNRRRRHNNNNNNNTENSTSNTGSDNTGRGHSHQHRTQSPHNARSIHQNHRKHQNHQRHHPQQQPQHEAQRQQHKKTIISEPEPLVSKANLGKLLKDPIPPLIISFDVENASGTWLGEIWQIGAVSSASSISNTSTDASMMEVDHQQSSSTFLINMLPVGTIYWGVTKHCSNVRVNHDQRTGRRCLWHTVRKEELIPTPVDPPTGLTSFLDWIEAEQKLYYNAAMARKDDKRPSAAVEGGSASSPSSLPAVILLAHGNLDYPNLLNNLAEYNLLSRFESLVAGFFDSQRYLKNGLAAISDRLFPNETFDAHNALADALVLYRALHIKQPPPPEQGDTLPADRLALVEPLQDTFIATPDAIAVTRYKVSKLVQKLAQQNTNNQNNTVRNITALLSVDNVAQLLKNVVLLDLGRKEGGSRPPEVFLVEATNSGYSGMGDDGSYGSNNTTVVAFDVQFSESTGVRSHIHRICAMELGCENGSSSSKDDGKHGSSSTSTFDMTCVPPDELHLLSTCSNEKSHTTKEILEQFIDWLTTARVKRNHEHVVLCAYASRKRKWPGLLNHLSYHGLEAKCASAVVGVCDLALAMTNTTAASSNNNSNAAKNLDAKSQDKAHKAFCPNDKNGPPIPHRANEVCQSNCTIANEVIHRRSSLLSSPADSNNADHLLPLLETTITYRSAYVNAQFLLDQSLGADIMAGVQFDGNGQAYKGHRLPRLQ